MENYQGKPEEKIMGTTILEKLLFVLFSLAITGLSLYNLQHSNNIMKLQSQIIQLENKITILEKELDK